MYGNITLCVSMVTNFTQCSEVYVDSIRLLFLSGLIMFGQFSNNISLTRLFCQE